MNLRIIYDYDIPKVINQYNQIKSFFPNHELVIYNSSKQFKNIKFKKCKYNIYIDTISEIAYNNLPSDYTILLCNEEYLVVNKYLRREDYINKPLILIENVVNYYYCLTKYIYNYLAKTTSKNKLIYLSGLTSEIYNIKIKGNKYILYIIDPYSSQDNLLILKTWITYFIDRPEILIIHYRYDKDEIILYLCNLLKINKIIDTKEYTFKNIIIFNDAKYLDQYNMYIYAVIINTSFYALTTILYENILKNIIIIAIKNDITNDILYDSKSLISVNKTGLITESQIKNKLNNLFNDNILLELVEYTNICKKKLLYNIVKTQKKIIKMLYI